MSTDTEVIEDTQTRSQTRVYFSHNKTYIIPRVKPDEMTLPSGKMVVKNQQEYDRFRIEFQDGFFYAEPGDLVCVNEETGQEEDVITYLENHPRFGREFFLQQDQAPDATAVVIGMAELIAAQDVDGLLALYQQEEENWARPQVLEPIRSAVAKFQQLAEKG